MQIRTKLTLQFSIIVALILLLFSVAIYYFSSNYRKQEFYLRLKEKAITTVKYLSDVDEIDKKLLKLIDRNSVNLLPEERVIIYNYQNKLIYKSLDDTIIVANNLLNSIRLKKEIEFNEGTKEAVGIVFNGKNERFVVIASAYDKYGRSKIKFLGGLLIGGFFVTIGLIVVIGLFYSRQALNPIMDVIKQVDSITATNLDLRVHGGNGKDEIAQLAINFNQMLERLEAAFEMQRSFVSHASHELRTPLTAITGQIEVSLMNKNIDEESKQILKSVLDDIKGLNKLSNGLLDLAQANLDISEVKFSEIRIDELLGQARAELLKRNKNYTVNIEFDEFPEEEHELQLNANEQLLRVAIINLIENACKYSSNNTATVQLQFYKNQILMYIKDNGVGIPEHDLEKIFDAFYRSNNVRSKAGNGIGLTLTRRITLLHKGNIKITSIVGIGTTVTLVLPNKLSH